MGDCGLGKGTLKTSLNKYITYEEFLALKHQYEDDVKTFKMTFDKKYVEQVKTLELNANNKLLNIKDEANKKLNELEKMYRELVVLNYNKGDVERMLDIICYNHYITKHPHFQYF